MLFFIVEWGKYICWQVVNNILVISYWWKFSNSIDLRKLWLEASCINNTIKLHFGPICKFYERKIFFINNSQDWRVKNELYAKHLIPIRIKKVEFRIDLLLQLLFYCRIRMRKPFFRWFIQIKKFSVEQVFSVRKVNLSVIHDYCNLASILVLL